MKLAIPIQVCEHVLKYRIVNPFRTYMLLKSICSGKIRYDKKQLSVVLNISDKTLDKHLLELKKLNWIGYNPQTGNLFIRGFEKIREMHNFNSRLAIVCSESDFKTFRAFLFGAMVSHTLIKKKENSGSLAQQKRGLHHTQAASRFLIQLQIVT
jgi:hypothetical protein